MRYAALFIALFLILVTPSAFLLAQSGNASSAPTPPEKLPWDQSAMTGCLQFTVDHYILRDEDGTVHELSGAGGKLKKLVDRQVEIIGKKGTRTIDRTAPGGASTVATIAVFEVKSVKQLADTCKAPGE
jgi:hypothetical protein